MHAKKEQIINTAIRLFYIEGTTIPTARIAKESGVSNGTLFNIFATKQLLFDSVYIAIKEEISGLFKNSFEQAGSTEELFKGGWDGYIDWAANNMEKQRVCHLLEVAGVLSPDICDKVDIIFKEMIDKIQDAQNQGIIVDIPINFLCDMAGAMLRTTVEFALKNNYTEHALADHSTNSFSMFWNSIKK